MSELILKDKDKSLQNAILRDGQFVFGEITNNSSITSSGLGSFASGRVDVSSSISVTLPGSHAFGTASNNSSISNHALGTLLFGRADTSSNISAASANGGCITFGYAFDKSTIRTTYPGTYTGGNAITNGVILSAGNGAFAHGYVGNSSIHAKGDGSHAEGSAYNGSQIVADDGALAWGFADNSSIYAKGSGTHAMGLAYNESLLTASENGAHAEGFANKKGLIISSGAGSHVEGYAQEGTIKASAIGAHAQGDAINGSIIADGNGAFAFGHSTENGNIDSSGFGSLAFGCTEAYIDNGTAHGNSSIISTGQGSIAGGRTYYDSSILSNGGGSIAFGCAATDSKIEANSEQAVAIGFAGNHSKIISSSIGSHAEGYADHYGNIIAEGDGAHAEGYASYGYILAKGDGAHAEGINTVANGNGAHAEGRGGFIKIGSAEGIVANTDNKAIYIHNSYMSDEMLRTVKMIKIGNEYEYYYVTELVFRSGNDPQIFVDHAISNDKAYSDVYYVCGAHGDYSHVSGESNIACRNNQMVIGEYNKPDQYALFIVGNGTDNENRSNAFAISSYGVEQYQKLIVDGCPRYVDWPQENLKPKYNKYFSNDTSNFILECDDYIWMRECTTLSGETTCMIKKPYKIIEINQTVGISGTANLVIWDAIYDDGDIFYVANIGSEQIQIHSSTTLYPKLSSGRFACLMCLNAFGAYNIAQRNVNTGEQYGVYRVIHPLFNHLPNS